MPLLHTWSLSVEEQFYIFFPVAAFLIFKATSFRGLKWFIAAAVVTSFVLVGIAAEWHRASAFYLLPMRAWELLIGSLVAVSTPMCRELSVRTINLVSWSGLLLVAIPMTTVIAPLGFSEWHALAVCSGAAMIIATTSHGSGGNGVASILSVGPIRFVGKISYSLYLWHWPIFVFYSFYVMRSTTAKEVTALVAVSVFISWASWRWIETPIRTKAILPSHRTVFETATVTTGLLGLVG